jgi:hypothetical protein
LTLFSTEQSAGFKKSIPRLTYTFFLPNNQLDSKNYLVQSLVTFFYRTISWIQKIQGAFQNILFSTEQSAGFKKYVCSVPFYFFLPNNQLDSKNKLICQQRTFFYRTISWIQKIILITRVFLFSTEQSAGFKK